MMHVVRKDGCENRDQMLTFLGEPEALEGEAGLAGEA